MPISILAVSQTKSLVTRDTPQSPWKPIGESGSVLSVARMPDGTFVGVGASNNWLCTRQSLFGPWVEVANSGAMVDVAVMPDGTILGVGTDRTLYTRASLTSSWVQVPSSGSVIAVDVMPDGTILGVGADRSLCTRATLTSSWVQVPSSGQVLSACVMNDGTILGVGENFSLYTRQTLASAWQFIPNSDRVISVTAIRESDLLWATNLDGGWIFEGESNIVIHQNGHSLTAERSAATGWTSATGALSGARLTMTFNTGRIRAAAVSEEQRTIVWDDGDRWQRNVPVWRPRTDISATRISVGSANHIVAYSPGGYSYGWLPTGWVRFIGFIMSSISAHLDDSILCVESGGRLYYVSKLPPTSAAIMWRGAPSPGPTAKMVSGVSMSLFWVIAGDNTVYRYANGTWKNFGPSFLLKHISVGGDGTVCGVTPSNKVMRYLGDENWAEMPGTMTLVAVGSADYIWALDALGNVYSFTSGGQWQQAEGKMDWIELGVDGEVWGCQGSTVYQYMRDVVPIVMGVIAYTGASFTGEKHPIPLGDHTGAALSALLGGNTIASMDIPAGIEVAVFTSAELIGEHVVIQSWQDAAALLTTLTGPIAGIQIRRIEVPKEIPAHVTIYAEPNYWGKKFELPQLRDYTKQDLAAGLDENLMSSIKVPPGLKATLFDNNTAQAKGSQKRSVVYTGNVYQIAADLNEQVTSMRIEAS